MSEKSDRGRGRPAEFEGGTRLFATSLPNALFDEVERELSKSGMTRASMLRAAAELWLKFRRRKKQRSAT